MGKQHRHHHGGGHAGNMNLIGGPVAEEHIIHHTGRIAFAAIVLLTVAIVITLWQLGVIVFFAPVNLNQDVSGDPTCQNNMMLHYDATSKVCECTNGAQIDNGFKSTCQTCKCSGCTLANKCQPGDYNGTPASNGNTGLSTTVTEPPVNKDPGVADTPKTASNGTVPTGPLASPYYAQQTTIVISVSIAIGVLGVFMLLAAGRYGWHTSFQAISIVLAAIGLTIMGYGGALWANPLIENFPQEDGTTKQKYTQTQIGWKNNAYLWCGEIMLILGLLFFAYTKSGHGVARFEKAEEKRRKNPKPKGKSFREKFGEFAAKRKTGAANLFKREKKKAEELEKEIELKTVTTPDGDTIAARETAEWTDMEVKGE